MFRSSSCSNILPALAAGLFFALPALAHDTHREALIDRIKRDEGWRAKPYRDSVGKLTVGFGTNLDAGITPSQGECMLVVSLDTDEAALRAQWTPYQTLSGPVRAVLLEMAYNLGTQGLLGFHNMLAALEGGDYDKAADEALDSKWAREVPARAHRLAEIIRAG